MAVFLRISYRGISTA